jgi:hypothetical protein
MARVLDLTGRAQQIFRLLNNDQSLTPRLMKSGQPVKVEHRGYDVMMTTTVLSEWSYERCYHISDEDIDYKVIEVRMMYAKPRRVRKTETRYDYWSDGNVTPEQLTKLLLVL